MYALVTALNHFDFNYDPDSFKVSRTKIGQTLFFELFAEEEELLLLSRVVKHSE
jgi:hypothetical protein